MTSSAPVTVARRPSGGLGLGLLLTLSLLSATAPLSIDFYVASLPELAADLGTSPAGGQLTVTAFVIGLGVGQLFWGPVSDRFGRRIPLLVGSVLCAIAAIAAAVAPSIEVLVAARAIQAIFGSACMVISRALLADRFEGTSLARAMSLVLTVHSTAPVVAPVLGGALAGVLPWRAMLSVVAAVAALQVLCSAMVVPETLDRARRTKRLSLGPMWSVARRPAYVAYAAVAVLTFGGTMSYIASSSFLYQDLMGWSPAAYGVAFAVNALGLTGCGLASARLAGRGVPPARTVGRAVPFVLVSAVAVLAVASAPVPSRLLMVPLFTMVASVGFITANCSALALQEARDAAGAASALLGGAMLLFGGVVASVAGGAVSSHPGVLGVVATVCSLGALACLRVARRRTTAVWLPSQ